MTADAQRDDLIARQELVGQGFEHVDVFTGLSTFCEGLEDVTAVETRVMFGQLITQTPALQDGLGGQWCRPA